MKKYNSFQLAMMRRDEHMTYTEISAKTGIPVEEVRARIKEYHRKNRNYAGECYARNHARKGGKIFANSSKHPERNSQYAERSGAND